MPIRAVIDTKVFVGAGLGTGAVVNVLQAYPQSQVLPLMGAALMTGYDDGLAREDLMVGSRLGRAEREALLDIFIAQREWPQVYFTWRPNLHVVADKRLIELAVAGAAAYLVRRNLRDASRTSCK